MRDDRKTKAELIAELQELRQGGEHLLTTQSKVVRMIASGETIPNILERLCLLIEQQSAGGFCSILFLDTGEGKLGEGIAPTLPRDYANALNGLVVGEGQGSCGTAAARGEQVIVHDIATDPLWEKFRDLALSYGIRSCWSTPFFSQAGKVFGTFAISHNEPCSPNAHHRQLIQTATHLAAIAIERQQAQERMNESEQRLRSLIEASPDVIQFKDSKGRWLEANDACLALFLLNDVNYYGKTDAQLAEATHPVCREALQMCKTSDELAWKQKKISRHEETIPQPDGTTKVIDVIKIPLFESDDSRKAMVILGRDITERKQAEEALNASLKTLQEERNIFTGGSVVVFKWRNLPDWPVEYVSPNVAAVFGYSAEDFLSGKVVYSKIVSSEDLPRVGEEVRIGSESGEANFTHQPYRIVHKDGHNVWLFDYTVILRNDQGEITHYLGYVVDISHEKEAEAEKAKLEKQLRRTQKMETIGTLAGGIAHDFNNILTPILGYAEMALSSLPQGDLLADDLRQVLKGGQRAKDLVNQILSFSRQQEQERKPLYLHLLIKEVLQLMRPLIPATIEIQPRIDASCQKVSADASQIHQVLVNLITNAFQAMEAEGGLLAIELKQIEVSDVTAKIYPNLNPQEYVLLSIRDTGIGMDEATIERIFEPFFTTKPIGRGTGLGLSVVHGIVQAHEGEIIVKSEPGKGATFQIYFPVLDGETGRDEKYIPASLGGSGSVLVVDDEAAVADVVQRMLNKFGYDATAKVGSIEALKAFRENPEAYDLVVTDYTMPYMTGLELAREITKVRPNVPVVLITGYGKNLEGDLGKDYGIQGVVSKPVTPRELALAIQNVLAKKSENV